MDSLGLKETWALKETEVRLVWLDPEVKMVLRVRKVVPDPTERQDLLVWQEKRVN